MGTASTKVKLGIKKGPVWQGVDQEGHRYRYSANERDEDCVKCKQGQCMQKVVEVENGYSLIIHDSWDLN